MRLTPGQLGRRDARRGLTERQAVQRAVAFSVDMSRSAYLHAYYDERRFEAILVEAARVLNQRNGVHA